MFRIIGPIPGPYITIVLPSPQLGDQLNTIGDVRIAKSMNGTIYTTKKSKGNRRRLQWQFYISHNKALEVKEFLKRFTSQVVQIIDHNDVTWLGYCMSNPFSFTDNTRASGSVNEEFTNITLTFEEKS
jgi:hypothetical protein